MKIFLPETKIVVLCSRQESNITCSVPVLDILFRLALTKYLKTASIP